MSPGAARPETVRRPVVAPGARRSLWRLSAYLGGGLAGVVLAVAVLGLAFGNTILNGYGKGRIERAFSAAHPGCTLHLGELDYAVGADRLVAHAVTFATTNATLRIAEISLTGVRWVALLRRAPALTDVFAQSRVEATHLELAFPNAHYGIRCARLEAAVPEGELVLGEAELRPLDGDEAFFAAHAFRATRFHLVIAEGRVSGLAYGALLQGHGYRASSVQLSHPSLEALVNRDQPLKAFVKSPLMVHEALAAIRPPFQVDSVSITHGNIRYCVRMAAGAYPAVLTFGNVSASVEGLANRPEAAAAIQVQAQGDLMEAGTLKVLMSIPTTPADLSLHYSGSLGAMDLTRLNDFLDIAQHVRVKSGSAREAAFAIEVTAGQARGWVRATYEDLGVAVLDAHTGTEQGFDNRVTSFLANVLKVRNANAPDASGSIREGKVDYRRAPEDGFLEFVWSALWSGVRDLITL